MKVLKSVAGGHDPRVLVGSTPKYGIDWGPGTEIVVTDELAANYERSGMASRVEEPPTPAVATPEVATLTTPETATKTQGRRRARA